MPELLAGVPLYPRSEVPAYLRTYRQLAKAGLRPAQIDQPDGVYLLKETRIWLYDYTQARPYSCTTKRASVGQQIVERKRKRYTCVHCGSFHNDWRWIRQIRAGAGRCASCRSAGSAGQ